MYFGLKAEVEVYRLLISYCCNFVRKLSEQSSMRRLKGLNPAFQPSIAILILDIKKEVGNILLSAFCSNRNSRRSRFLSVWKFSFCRFVFWNYDSTQQRSRCVFQLINFIQKTSFRWFRIRPRKYFFFIREIWWITWKKIIIIVIKRDPVHLKSGFLCRK